MVIRCDGPWMVARFERPRRCLSWAVVNGGAVHSDTVAWLFLQQNEIANCHDVPAWFHERLAAAGLENAVGLLTSRRRHAFVESGAGTECHVVATVGLSNALAAGDPVSAPQPGTINVVGELQHRLTHVAALEALALASEARTAAMLEAAVPSIVSGRPASGTGTDCIVIAHAAEGHAEPYCGKHTHLGHLIGARVREAVAAGVRQWLEEFRR